MARSSVTMGKKASAAETVLLKALGIAPVDLEVNDNTLHEFLHFYDSSVQE